MHLLNLGQSFYLSGWVKVPILIHPEVKHLTSEYLLTHFPFIDLNPDVTGKQPSGNAPEFEINLTIMILYAVAVHPSIKQKIIS